MTETSCIVVLNNIKLPINASEKEAFSVAKRRLSSIGLVFDDEDFFIFRRSTDARRKDNILFVYSVGVNVFDRVISSESVSKIDGTLINESTPEIVYGNAQMSNRPVIVGSGPAGLFFTGCQAGYQCIDEIRL